MGGKIKTNNTRILIVIDKELKERLETRAKKDKRSMSNYINVLIEEHLNQLDQQE